MKHKINSRGERKLQKEDLSEGAVLQDKVHGEEVEVVGLYVGQVYLRYPHHEHKQEYRHDCGAVLLGREELKEHCEECDDGNDEWWELSKDPVANNKRMREIEENGNVPYDRIDREGVHVESVSYDWPLDGHRFEKQ